MKNITQDWSDFELFKDVGKRSDEPFITISKFGRGTLNSGFLSKNYEKLKGKTHVKLGYSKSNNIIALEFTNDEKDQASLKLTLTKNKSNATFAICSFANNYNLDLEKIAGRYPLHFESIPRWGNYFTVKLGM